MRYTEARLARIADELLQDIDKETVDFVDNFDGSLKEPSILPAKLPNLLVNGTTGIAVGMATNIPPHNLVEVCDALIALIEQPGIEPIRLLEHIKGPDFPTGGEIVGRSGLLQAYATGRGSITVRGILNEEKHGERLRLIITQIPYQVNKTVLIEQIAEQVNEKRLDGISDLRDESDRDGMRIVIELKRDANPAVVQNQLLAQTSVQVSFGINMVALVHGQPRTLGLKPLLEHYLAHRREIVRRRTQFELKKAEERAHIVEGLTRALARIDAVVALIKAAANVEAAQQGLMANFALSEPQAAAILDMKLQKLAALEQRKLHDELSELRARIAEYTAILASEQRILALITQELRELKQLYPGARRTAITDADADELVAEDLIEPQDQVVTVSHAGYLKRTALTEYREQRRGGTGVKGATTKEDDFIEHVFVANTHDWLLLFTDKGKVYWKKVYQLPEGSRASKGRPVINLVSLEQGERVTTFIPIKEFRADEYLFFATSNGTVKKTPLEEYSRPRTTGIRAITLDEGDALVSVLKTNGKDQLLLASAKGQAVKFLEDDVRAMGRSAGGVRGIKLKQDDKVVGAILAPEDKSVLTVTANGYGKRSAIADYRLISRGGSGVINIICSERNGDVVSVLCTNEQDQLMVSTTNGTLIRMRAADMRVIGRNTQGVRIMRLREDDRVAACAHVYEESNGVE